jgi:putative oxidoreductase
MLVVHGTQIFNGSDMEGYGDWLADLGIPLSLYASYAGKIIELVGGILFVLGIFTRLAAVTVTAAFLFITLMMGNGHIFGDAQHAFLFALFGCTFLFMGPGPWSIDNYLRIKREKQLDKI